LILIIILLINYIIKSLGIDLEQDKKHRTCDICMKEIEFQDVNYNSYLLITIVLELSFRNSLKKMM
jgi:hypothetical protein